jgi:hypothetical protein
MGGYAFGSGGYGGGVQPVQSPQISPLGIVVDKGGNEGAPAGPNAGMNATAGPMGRAALASDLNSTMKDRD